MVCQFLNGMVCPSATSKAEARWLRFGLVVVATTSRRDDKDQMIRPLTLSYMQDRKETRGKKICMAILRKCILQCIYEVLNVAWALKARSRIHMEK
jgi:hypothetical protein